MICGWVIYNCCCKYAAVQQQSFSQIGTDQIWTSTFWSQADVLLLQLTDGHIPY